MKIVNVFSLNSQPNLGIAEYQNERDFPERQILKEREQTAFMNNLTIIVEFQVLLNSSNNLAAIASEKSLRYFKCLRYLFLPLGLYR